MKKVNTVKKQQEFNDIIKNGNKVMSNFFVINYINNNLNYSRYGVSVGTKIGNAVIRNKYKRKMRMIIHENKIIEQTKKDYIIIFRKHGLNKKYEELKSDFNKLISRIEEQK